MVEKENRSDLEELRASRVQADDLPEGRPLSRPRGAAENWSDWANGMDFLLPFVHPDDLEAALDRILRAMPATWVDIGPLSAAEELAVRILVAKGLAQQIVSTSLSDLKTGETLQLEFDVSGQFGKELEHQELDLALEYFGSDRNLSLTRKPVKHRLTSVGEQHRYRLVEGTDEVVERLIEMAPARSRVVTKLIAKPQPRPESRGTGRKKVSLDEANKIAMKLAAKDPQFITGSAPEWAKGIGCSVGLVPRLPLWDKVMEETGRGRRKGPLQGKVVSFDETIESRAGEIDAELNRLIEEQATEIRQDEFLVTDPETGRKGSRLHKRL